MKDMTKASNPFYLAFFLLLVCGVSTLVMAVTAVKTDGPIREAQEKETNEWLKKILPEFDKKDTSIFKSIKSLDDEGEEKAKLEIKLEEGNNQKTIKITAATEEGLQIAYSTDRKKWDDYKGPVSVPADGTYYFKVTDSEKNRLAEKEVSGNKVTIYTAYNKGQVVGYAAEAKGNGFGGDVNGLISFEPDGTIRTIEVKSEEGVEQRAGMIIKSGHSETPGIGTRVTDRTVKRTISDLIKGKKVDTSNLASNTALDAYRGQKPGDTKWTKETAPRDEKGNSTFVSGATYSSNAVCDLVWDAATAVRDYLAASAEKKEEN